MRSMWKRIQERSSQIPFQHQNLEKTEYQSSKQKDKREKAFNVYKMHEKLKVQVLILSG